MSTFLSINTTNAGDNIDLWHHVTCRNFSESEYWRESDEPFDAHILSKEFGALTLSDVSLSTAGMIRLVRSPAAIRKDPRDHFMVFLVEQGGVGVSQDGRQIQAQAGDLFLYDQTRPFTLEFQQRYAGLMVNIPRPLLESRLHTASRLTAHRISGESKLGALAGTMVRQIHGLDQQLKHDAVNCLGASALDILAMTLNEKSSNECISNPRHHRLLAQVKEYMLAHLHDSSLDIETVARAQNMAPRTLSRLFAIEGTTPIRWLWQQRLAASHRALAEGRTKNVTDAALDFGFSDLSHFSRAFKAMFGKSPNALLRR